MYEAEEIYNFLKPSRKTNTTKESKGSKGYRRKVSPGSKQILETIKVKVFGRLLRGHSKITSPC